VTNREAGRFEWFGRFGELGSANNLHAAFSRDGSTVAVGSDVANVIVLWDTARGREIRRIEFVGAQAALDRLRK
jgi:hypothetical protein